MAIVGLAPPSPPSTTINFMREEDPANQSCSRPGDRWGVDDQLHEREMEKAIGGVSTPKAERGEDLKKSRRVEMEPIEWIVDWFPSPRSDLPPSRLEQDEEGLRKRQNRLLSSGGTPQSEDKRQTGKSHSQKGRTGLFNERHTKRLIYALCKKNKRPEVYMQRGGGIKQKTIAYRARNPMTWSCFGRPKMARGQMGVRIKYQVSCTPPQHRGQPSQGFTFCLKIRAHTREEAGDRVAGARRVARLFTAVAAAAAVRLAAAVAHSAGFEEE
ncbi:hypothetical protein BDK51DRAFT_48098 [Blyttiomyces helicus]|uniref:Uncharacterized protein n=1 Tax=Blyttiomyces helicus TaxID=388810 RepID=A0A4V1IQ51_9FUNG|nr:hypothetical protein BDK51DRAFT_48098 [Blyttiomyces helicus]|eukprot:RKO85337.1 hypothetical protein BDK51DRAFT_48098 [Blyttiomyces helicus]